MRCRLLALRTSLIVLCMLSPLASAFSPIPRSRYHLSKYKTQISSSSDGVLPEFGLYEQQEALIVDRGAFEGTLMADTHSPLQAHKPKVRGVGTGGGFGGGGGSSKTKKKKKKGGNNKQAELLKAEGEAHAKVLIEQGVVRIDNVISDKTADELREFVINLRAQATKEVEDGEVPKRYRFADVLLQKNRCDLVLPLGPDVVMRALDELLNKSAMRPAIEALLGPDAVLYEFSCLISDPGSQRQVVHPDTPWLEKEGPVLYTTFVALQDVREDMGPTVWLPRTHTKEAHEDFKVEIKPSGEGESPKDRLLRTTPSKLGQLPKGCCGIYDSRLLHCGGANISENSSRALFYVSFKNPEIGYPGNPASIRPEIGAAKLSITELGDELEAYRKGKPCPKLDKLVASLR